MNRRVLAALVVVSAMVLAGCGAFGGPGSPTDQPGTTSMADSPSATTTSTATPSIPDNQVRVYGDLPVNATLVWERVESMFPGEYEPPVVTVLNDRPGGPVSPFPAHLGLDEGVNASTAGSVAGRYVYDTDRVGILPRNGSPTEIERILAHEYVHAIQYQTDFVDQARASGIWRVMIEGGAVYGENVYTQEFLGFSTIERRCERYRTGTPYERYVGQAYCFGGQYFAETLGSPGDLLAPKRRLPNTTEQVLHPEMTDRPTNLTVGDETPTGWSTPASMDRRGELLVRTVLDVELSETRAADAAAGWGNDRLLTVTGDTEGYVWVLRWDTDGDADTFERAFADYLDARGNKITDGWHVGDDHYRLSVIDERTIAVVTGTETLVESVVIERQNTDITVSADRTV